MEKLTLSSSLRHKELIRETIARLADLNVVALFPNLDSGVTKEAVTIEFMKKIERDHFDAIDESKALYVICPEGKVGLLVSLEIGYAKAHEKPIIFSEQPEDLGLQAMADAYIPLSELDKLKDLINE